MKTSVTTTTLAPLTLAALVAFFAMTAFASTSSLRAAPLKVGDTAPAVTCVTDNGATVNLGDVYRKNKYTLVYFYPKADTPGCTAQGCSLRDAYDPLTKAGVSVIGVSLDTMEAQHAFREKYHFQFPLVTDTDRKVKNAFGVPGEKYDSRQAYLIENGKVIYADYKGSTTQQANDILAVIATNTK